MDLVSILTLAGGGALAAGSLSLAWYAIAKVSGAGEREAGAWKGKVEEARQRILSDSAREKAEAARDNALATAKKLGADVARERARGDSLQERLTDAQRRLADKAIQEITDPNTSVAVGAVDDILRAEVPTTVRPRGGGSGPVGRPPR